ncbi:hypothetical protein PIB30_099057 [Stylosanthes scabra]|uniref:Uncharacterized protein n=1 Tax=Stylosanthes scabra TaxID=79078 RepID=A0ABU6WZE0_9FABA|nr:hypothetical protein [Stylosanthes scabra]
MAHKTVVPHHLGPGAPSERNSPSSPPRGPPRCRTTTARTPAPPPSSCGKRLIHDEEETSAPPPPPQPKRSGNFRSSLLSTSEPLIADPVAFKRHLDEFPAETYDKHCFNCLRNWFFYKYDIMDRPIVPQFLVSLDNLASKGLDFLDLFDIILDRYKIAEALGYHETGICVFTSGKWDSSLGVDYLVAVKSICDNFGGHAAKKQATRGKRTSEPSTSPRPHSSRKSSMAKKIKKHCESYERNDGGDNKSSGANDQVL